MVPESGLTPAAEPEPSTTPPSPQPYIPVLPPLPHVQPEQVPPGGGAAGYGAASGYGGQPSFGAQPGYGAPPGWSAPPGYGVPPGYPPMGYSAFVAPAPQPPAVLPVEPREYHEFCRTPALRWWRPLAAIGMFLGSWVVFAAVTTILALSLGWLGPGDLDLTKTTARQFIANNIWIAVGLPLALLTSWACFRQRPRWLSSITGGFRWRLFGRFAAVSGGVLLAQWAIEVAFGGPVTGLAWNKDSLILIVAIIVTTPLQSAAEEYFTRGLLARVVGAWIPYRLVGLVAATMVSSVVFMLLHGAGDPWLNAFYLLFGVAQSLLVWRTGGLEAAVALHVCNNLVSEVTLPFTSLDGLFDRQAGVAGPETLIQMAAIVLVVVALWWQAARLHLVRASAPAAATAPVLTSH